MEANLEKEERVEAIAPLPEERRNLVKAGPRAGPRAGLKADVANAHDLLVIYECVVKRQIFVQRLI